MNTNTIKEKFRSQNAASNNFQQNRTTEQKPKMDGKGGEIRHQKQ
jgi:hypothetical protein